jgi:tryptophan 2,3-dioxygenase
MTDNVTYGSYLKIDELLSLQQCRSVDAETGEPEHEETLFIVIHQVYELWFKQILHELDELVRRFGQDRPHRAGHQLKRVLKILKTLVGQLDVLETMTPLEFAEFRAFLEDASGFQSAQFRELEFLLGVKDHVSVEWFERNPREYANLTRRFTEPTLWDAFLHLLHRLGYDIPADVLNRDVTQPVEPSEALQRTLIEIYREDSSMAVLCEALIDFDEGLQEWRYRHVMMVQRTIGTKMGTGGSDGATYLRSTLFHPAFPDLWAIRSAF